MSNKIKDILLGEPHGTAAAKLRKALLFKYVKIAGHDVCYRCQRQIVDIANFSIEHKTPWQIADDPKTAFFDLGDIAFSHLDCNIKAGRKINRNTWKTHCHRGHPFTIENTRITTGGKRRCRECRMERQREGLSWG